MDYEVHIYNEVTGHDHWLNTYNEESYDDAFERACEELECDLHNDYNLGVKYQDFETEGSKDYYDYKAELRELMDQWTINVNELGEGE